MTAKDTEGTKMALKIYNTLTGSKEEFKPLNEKKVGMYVCGVTVYDLCHMGHARSLVVFDVIFRYLTYLGYRVTYVRNFTDVDDKIIKKANEEGVECRSISEKYIREFYRDTDALGIKRATFEPKATMHIKEIIAMIEKLEQNGYAYRVDGDVFYSIDKFKGYGKLSGRDIEELKAGARVVVDDRKSNPLDFTLWKGSKPGEPFWESPWGKGRPGWHIECSAMSTRYLGDNFDIHGGGRDLAFPHHENEIAQSEGATGKPFANYWIHNGFVNINSEKMSKSLGNFFTIQEVLKRYHPEAIRLFLLSKHYRSPIDYSEENIREANDGLDRLYATIESMDELIRINKKMKGKQLAIEEKKLSESEREIYRVVNDLPERFQGAMDDDFNSALATGYLFGVIKDMNRYLNEKFKPNPASVTILDFSRNTLRQLGKILGILTLDAGEYLKSQRLRMVEKLRISQEDIVGLIEKRGEARKNKNWSEADRIRDELAKQGIILEDGPEETTWKVKLAPFERAVSG